MSSGWLRYDSAEPSNATTTTVNNLWSYRDQRDQRGILISFLCTCDGYMMEWESMQNQLQLESSVGCGWFMVCWNASCGYNVNRKSLNGDPLWLLCWLRSLDRDGQQARRREPATVASSNGLSHIARIKTKHMTRADRLLTWPSTTVCWPEARENRTAATSLTARTSSAMHINPYPTAFPYGNGMVLHFYQQQESSTTKTVHKVINKGLKAYV